MNFSPVVFLLLFTLALGHEAGAQIIYTDFVPDTTIAPPVNSGFSASLDLNKDGKSDFTIGANNFTGYAKVNISGTARTDQIAGDGQSDQEENFFPIAFNHGELVGVATPSQLWVNFWDTTFNHGLPSTIAGYGLSGPGHWIPQINGRYLGVRISIGGRWRYGWIGIDISAQTNALTLRDCAIESSPDTPIRAGFTTTGMNLTPSPGGIALDAYADVLRVQLDGGVASATVMLQDAMGRRIRSIVVETPGATLSLRDLPRGLYFATGLSGRESIVRKVAVR